MNYLERFRVVPGTAVILKDIDPRFKNHREGHKEAAQDIEHIRKEYHSAKTCSQRTAHDASKQPAYNGAARIHAETSHD